MKEDKERYHAFASLVAKWGRIYNLSGARSEKTILEEHVRPSLAFGPHIESEAVIDIGSGAGFPGIPLAIAYPEKQFLLLEPMEKRVAFLRQAIFELDLDNALVQAGRAQDFCPPTPFSVAVSRAFASPEKLIEAAEHLVAPEGMMLVATQEKTLPFSWEMRVVHPRQPRLVCLKRKRRENLRA